jgi:hypothetical protein
MNVYTCKTFTGHWPVGTAAVVHAETKEQAAEILNDELHERGLPGDAKPEDMRPFPDLPVPQIRILCDGNY